MLKPNQEEGFNFLREHDPTFTVEEFLFNGGMYVGYWTKKDPADAIARRRLMIHRETELEKYDAKSWNAGRCYNKGTESWKRKDGSPLTEKDMESLNALSYGQVTRVTPAEDMSHVDVYWACDSSD